MSTRRTFLKSLAATAALSQAPLSASIVRPFLESADPETVKSLDTGWEFYQGPLDGPWQVWHGDEIAVWQPVTVPHCVNHYDACDPDTPYYRGHAWYRTSIPAALPPNNGRVLLHFEGAGQTSHVYLGNKLVGTHVGGYDEFVFDITDALANLEPISGSIKQPASTAQLSVLTDNSQDLERSPSDLSDFSLYGGLYRKVHLVVVPFWAIERVLIDVKAEAQGSATVRVTAYRVPAGSHTGPDPIYSISVFDPNNARLTVDMKQHVGEQQLNRDFGFPTVFEFSIGSPRRWSPDKPNLYKCVVTLTDRYGVATTVTERFGLKHAEFLDHGPFKLNGERLLLRGTQRHMDHAGFAAAQPEALIREEFKLMKEMGVNFLRLAHYQQTKLVLDLCDELGILVWEEAPWCRSGIGDKQWQEQTKQAFTNTILQHYNHPCVLIWGLGNEDDWPNEYPSVDKEAIRKFMQEMQALAKSLDPARHTSFRRCDFARDIPDTYSPSIWAGWYSGLYTEYQASLEKERERVKHLLHIEWGADSHARRHAEDPYLNLPHIDTGKGTAETGLAYRNAGGPARISRDGDWSETYACDLFDWHLKTQESLPWLAGTAQWIFKDFTTPLRAENPVPRINQKGLLERDMTKKEGYFVFQSYWTDEKTAPMVRLYGHTWPVRWGDAGQERTVRVYSNCPTAELFVNGQSAGKKQRDPEDFPCAGLRWACKFVAGNNTLKIVATNSAGKIVTDTISFTYSTAKWSKPAALHFTEVAQGLDYTVMEATLHDASGNLCLDARAVVRFSLAGTGKLIDNQGTVRGSRVVQLQNGRASINVQHNHRPQTVSVTTDGLPAAFYALKGDFLP